MVVQNYWNLKKIVDTQAPLDTPPGHSGDSNYHETSVISINSQDWNRRCNSQSNYPKMLEDWCLRKNLTIILGNSSTPTVSVTDTTMANRIDNSLSTYNVTYNTAAENGKEKTIFTITGTNTTSSAITITQIGICKQLYDYSPDNLNYYFLLAKENLETPLTIPVGQGFTLVYEWDEQ